MARVETDYSRIGKRIQENYYKIICGIVWALWIAERLGHECQKRARSRLYLTICA